MNIENFLECFELMGDNVRNKLKHCGGGEKSTVLLR